MTPDAATSQARALRVERWLIVALGLAALAALTLVCVYDPASPVFPIDLPCVLRRTTGVACPGCGATRGMHQLLHGHLAAALRLNPLVMLALPFALYLTAAWVARAFALPPRLPVPRWTGRRAWLLVTLIAAFTVVRNLPWWPCTLLYPG